MSMSCRLAKGSDATVALVRLELVCGHFPSLILFFQMIELKCWLKAVRRKFACRNKQALLNRVHTAQQQLGQFSPLSFLFLGG